MQENNQEAWSKIFLIERDLLENQKSINKLDASYQEILKKIDQLKDEVRNHKQIEDFEKRIIDLERSEEHTSELQSH